MNDASFGVVNLRFAHALMKDDHDNSGAKTWIAWVIAAALLIVVFGLVIYFHPWTKAKVNVEKS